MSIINEPYCHAPSYIGQEAHSIWVQMILKVRRIHVRITMQFSIPFIPYATIAAIVFNRDAHTTCMAPISAWNTCLAHVMFMIFWILIPYMCYCWQWRRKWLSQDTLRGMLTQCVADAWCTRFIQIHWWNITVISFTYNFHNYIFHSWNFRGKRAIVYVDISFVLNFT